MRLARLGATLVAGAAALASAVPAIAAPPDPLPYVANDAGGFRNVLPPGSNGLANATDLAAFLGAGVRPPHNDDQLGLVTHRATIKGKPYAYTRLRVTYFHEVDSAIGFSHFNNPDSIRGPKDFQRAANLIDYTFNWLYVDGKRIAYFNSGKNPLRARRSDPNLPLLGTPRFEWRGYEPIPALGARSTPFKRHPGSSTSVS